MVFGVGANMLKMSFFEYKKEPGWKLDIYIKFVKAYCKNTCELFDVQKLFENSLIYKNLILEVFHKCSSMVTKIWQSLKEFTPK